MKRNFKRKITALVVSGAMTLGLGAVYHEFKDYIPDTSVVVNYENQYFTFEELVNVYREIEAKSQDISSLSDESLISLADEWKKLYVSCERVEESGKDKDFFQRYKSFNMRKMGDIEDEICREIEARHLLATPQNDDYISMSSYLFDAKIVTCRPVSEIRSLENCFIKNYMENTDEVSLKDIHLIYDTSGHYYYCMYKRDNELVVKPCRIVRDEENKVDRAIFGNDEAEYMKQTKDFDKIFNMSTKVYGNSDKIKRAYFQNLDMSDYDEDDLWLYYIDIEREYEILDNISDEEFLDLCRKWISLKKNYQRLRNTQILTDEEIERRNEYFPGSVEELERSYKSSLDKQVHITTGEFKEMGEGLREAMITRKLVLPEKSDINLENEKKEPER